jgi:bile acid:Na+ symporter, BASS family
MPVKIVTIVLLVALFLRTGLGVAWTELRVVVRNGALLARAIVANVVVVPFAAVLLTWIVPLDRYVATGLLLVALAPGVPFVVAAGGRKSGGNVALAITLALVLPTLSVATLPVTARLVFPREGVPISIGHIVLPLVLFQLLPVVLGMTLRAFSPPLASRLERPTQLVVTFSLALVLMLLAPALGSAVARVFGTNGLIVSVALVAVSLAAGWLLAGGDRELRVTMAVGTALRNVGAALAIATTAFQNTIAGAEVLAYLVVQLLVVTLFRLGLARRTKRAPSQPIART